MRDTVPTAAEVRPAEGVHDLHALAQRINAEHAAGQESVAGGLAHYRAAGEELLRAKARVTKESGYGHWLQWVKDNLTFTDRRARHYMALARSEMPISDLEDEWRRICGQDDGKLEQDQRAELDRILAKLAAGQKLTPEEAALLKRSQAGAGAAGDTHRKHAPPDQRFARWLECSATMLARPKYQQAVPDYAVRVAETLVLPHLPPVVAERVRALLAEAQQHGA